jgi:hypothetical protein
MSVCLGPVAVRLYAYTVLIATAQTPSRNNYLRSPSEYSSLRNAELLQFAYELAQHQILIDLS